MFHIRFFSRVAFICNACFLFAVIIRFVPHLVQVELLSLIILLGFVVALIINALVNLYLSVSVIWQKSLPKNIPRWLVTVNFLFLIAEIIFFFK
jgi:hypothetical protein